MSDIIISEGRATDLPDIMTMMEAAFDPRFGEAWTASQCLSLLAMPGTRLTIARAAAQPVGFALARSSVGEGELMMLGVIPAARRCGIARQLLSNVVENARTTSLGVVFLEVRAGNPAAQLYVTEGFEKIGTRARYYRGISGEIFDAETYRRLLT